MGGFVNAPNWTSLKVYEFNVKLNSCDIKIGLN